MGTGFFLSGWLVDLDHIPDFVGTWGWRKGFGRLACLGFQKPDPRSAYLPLHAFEWIPLCGLAVWLYPSNFWLLGAVLGYLLHLLIDHGHQCPPTAQLFLLLPSAERILPRRRLCSSSPSQPGPEGVL